MEEEKDNQENGELDQKNSVLENNENEAQEDSNEDNKNIKDLNPEDENDVKVYFQNLIKL